MYFIPYLIKHVYIFIGCIDFSSWLGLACIVLFLILTVHSYRISSKERPGRSFKNQLARGGAQSRGRSFEGGARLKFRVFWGRSFYFVDI